MEYGFIKEFRTENLLRDFIVKGECNRMRSISCAIISFVLFYMALCFKKYYAAKGSLILLSFILIGIAIVLMIFGM